MLCSYHVILMNRQMGANNSGNGKMMNFGKSRARMITADQEEGRVLFPG